MNTLEKAHEGLTTALEVIRELQKQVSTLTEQKDRYKSLLDVESHRIAIATKTIEEYEDELGIEHELYDPNESKEKQERKAETARKHRCISYLKYVHGYDIS